MPQPHAPKSKPDARPMRLALVGGGVAALSALATAIVLPPNNGSAQPAAQQTVDPSQLAAAQLSDTPLSSAPIVYIQLAPGQTAPPGAIVIGPSGSAGSAGSSGSAAAGGGGTTAATPNPVVAQPTPRPTPTATPVPKPAPIATAQSGKVKK
jgi:hypothetical protein